MGYSLGGRVLKTDPRWWPMGVRWWLELRRDEWKGEVDAVEAAVEPWDNHMHMSG